MKRALQLKTGHIEFIKFCLVGVLNTLVDLSIYVLLTRSVPYLAGHVLTAKAFSFIGATICSFTLNRRWTFNKQGKVNVSEIIRFYGTVGSGIFINVGVVHVLHNLLHIYDIFAVLIATVFTVGWNFGFSKLWVFKK